MSIEAMKQALENGKRVRACEGGTAYQPDLEDNTIESLRQAIEQAEKQGPVAWVYLEAWMSGKVWPDDCFTENNASPEMAPLYTAPPKREWVGLTDDETSLLAMETWGCVNIAPQSAFKFARAVEAKLKEKNNVG